MNWTETYHCHSRVHCVSCRKQLPMQGVEFPKECPYGVVIQNQQEPPLPPVPKMAKNIAADTVVQVAKEVAPPRASEKWPPIVSKLKSLAHPGDKGLGDIVKHAIGDDRSDRFQAWFLETFGKSCGCKRRQAWLNERYPL